MSYMEYAESVLGGDGALEGAGAHTAEPLLQADLQEGGPAPADGTEQTGEVLGGEGVLEDTGKNTAEPLPETNAQEGTPNAGGTEPAGETLGGPAADDAGLAGETLDSEGAALEQGSDGTPGASEDTPGGEGKPGEAAQKEESLPEEKPKRRRTVRKKAADPAPEEAGGKKAVKKKPPSAPAADGGGTVQAAEGSEEDDDLQDADTAAFVLEEGQADGTTGAQDGQTEAGGGDTAPSALGSAKPADAKVRRPRRTASAKKEPEPKEQFTRRPLSSSPSLLSLDLNKLDEGLTEEEREEWNAIYASYRSKSILTGRITGIDSHSFTVRSRETGRIERRRMLCAVIISYRVKVLIPETEVWMPEQERPSHVLRNMSGAEIDYTILDVDREGGVAIGSRRMAMVAQRHFFDSVKGGRKLGERVTCRVLSVGPKRCLVECGGRDLSLTQKDLTYAATPDLRDRFHPGQTLNCILKEYSRQTGQLWISVKETTANPFFGAIKRHPIRSRRQATISGKYAGGVFCTLTDETVCLCHYSTRHSDTDFHVGDTVILAIQKFDYDRQLIYGIILSKL